MGLPGICGGRARRYSTIYVFKIDRYRKDSHWYRHSQIFKIKKKSSFCFLCQPLAHHKHVELLKTGNTEDGSCSKAPAADSDANGNQWPWQSLRTPATPILSLQICVLGLAPTTSIVVMWDRRSKMKGMRVGMDMLLFVFFQGTFLGGIVILNIQVGGITLPSDLWLGQQRL